jgi:hypothetical protein
MGRQWSESLSEAGTECAVVDGAATLKQKISAASPLPLDLRCSANPPSVKSSGKSALSTDSPVRYDSPMPIHPALKGHYAGDWRLLSDAVRFGRAGGRCEECDRPHRTLIYALADGRWFDPWRQVWRDQRGAPDQGPQPRDAASMRLVRVVIATAHLDHDPANRDPANLRALCQRCHLRHDFAAHLRQRRVTCRRRYAIGDLFLGTYPVNPLSSRVRAAVDPGPTDRDAVPEPPTGLCDLGQAEVDEVVSPLLLQRHIALPGQLQTGDQGAGPGRAPA